MANMATKYCVTNHFLKADCIFPGTVVTVKCFGNNILNIKHTYFA